MKMNKKEMRTFLLTRAGDAKHKINLFRPFSQKDENLKIQKFLFYKMYCIFADRRKL